MLDRGLHSLSAFSCWLDNRKGVQPVNVLSPHCPRVYFWGPAAPNSGKHPKPSLCRIYLNGVGLLVTDLNVERMYALHLEPEVQHLPQRTRLIQFDPDAERRMICGDRQPLVGTSAQSVSGRSLDHAVLVDLEDQYGRHRLPGGVVEHTWIRAAFSCCTNTMQYIQFRNS